MRAHEHPLVTDPIVLLSGLIALLALIATLVGLFWQEGSGQFSFRTVHGEVVEMFGQGIYRYDTLWGAKTVIMVERWEGAMLAPSLC
jgi:hypothetical protein